MDLPIKRILLIDDDEDDYYLTREMLNRAVEENFSLDWVPTYAEGWKAVQQDHYDAVLVDYDLGLQTGIDLIREAKAAGYQTPMIVLTGRGSYEIGIESIQAGAADYLRKGEVDLPEFKHSILTAIKKYRNSPKSNSSSSGQ